MLSITLSEEISRSCPELQVIALMATLTNSPSDDQLWAAITQEEEEVRRSMAIEEVNKWRPIAATRQAYKRLGKDPNRYRPSAEALRRRILRGLPLYRIDTLVDIINLVSIRSGFSIGGFDAEKIEGALCLGVGRAEEPYEAIGRGLLNIEGLPVYRDAIGGIGTPTSDEERTKITIDTTRLLLIINGYSGSEGLMEAAQDAAQLLRKYLAATQIEAVWINKEEQEEVTI